ncbi:MAG TPA: dihydrofolate reductase family protein [Pseudonocardiaceae bacterium]|nr:dihydrofolate reductase family protein [Pseudonocardiaceae bacterium]
MGKIVISENTSLDGVIQDPVGDGDFRFAGWFDRLAGKDREAWVKVEFEEAMGAEALLLGRRTYDWFVALGWPSRSGDWADRLRSMPKYVVSSSSLDGPEWTNSMVLGGGVVDAVTTLKHTVDGDVVVYGSGQLAHALIDHDLADELRLMLCPFVLGTGRRVFGETRDRKPVRLTDTRTVGDSLVQLTYQLVRESAPGA